MIAAYNKNLQPPQSKTAEEIVKKPHRLGRRHRFIIYIACDNDSVRLFIIYNIDYFIKDIFLILNQRKLIETLPEMKIRQVYEFLVRFSFI